VQHRDYYSPSGSVKNRDSTPKLNAHGFWAQPKGAVRNPTANHDCDLAISELRRYSDDKLVIVLSPQQIPAPSSKLRSPSSS
jgi:hypothetical protein